MSAEEATVNPDGSTTFEEPPVTGDAGAGAGADEPPNMDEEKLEEIAQGIDPAVFLLIAVAIFGALFYFFVYRKKKDDADSFFAELDGDKVRCKEKSCRCCRVATRRSSCWLACESQYLFLFF